MTWVGKHSRARCGQTRGAHCAVGNYAVRDDAADNNAVGKYSKARFVPTRGAHYMVGNYRLESGEPEEPTTRWATT